MASARANARYNERGLRDSGDPEFLHQMRVSVRGARTLLRPLRDVYDLRDVDRLGAELAWLARITGPTRDLDVFYELLPDYAAALPIEIRGDLEPFRRLLDDHRRRATSELLEELDSRRYRNLVRDWERFASRAEKDGRRTKRAARRVAREWTWRRYRRTRKWFDALHANSPATDVHRARIELKKLRYLIEFFRSLFPKKEVDRLLGPLKVAQDALGGLNDLVVHRSMIRVLARSAAYTHRLPSDTVIAMGELSAGLEESRRRRMADLPSQMKGLASKRSRRRFRKLYRP